MAPNVLTWAVQHGLVAALVRYAARRGELQARLIIDPATRADPYPVYDQVRAHGRFMRGRLSLVTASHEAVSAVLRSDAMHVGVDTASMSPLFRRALARREEGRIVGPIDPPSLLAVNPPEHTRYRKLVSKVFTPRAIAALEPRMERIADELLDDLERGGAREVDLVHAYASLLPVTVIADILGVPAAMRRQVLAWGHAAAPSLDVGLGWRAYRDTERGIAAFNDWMYGHVDRLRANPGEDLLSRLVTLDDDGERLTDRELVATAGLLLAAGFETTVNLIGTGAHLLVTHPDQLAELRADGSLWANAVDEILRYESPVQNTARWAASDLEICGRRIRQGTFVAVMIGGANRDPEVFPEPDAFLVRRRNAREHLAFSAGVHYCLGAALARVEGRIGLRRLFERFPDLALGSRPPTRRPTRTLRGYETLPVVLGPRRAATTAATTS